MAFDQSTRNRLQKFVNDARNLLTEEFTRQLQATYGLDPKAGSVVSVDSLTHLDNRQRQTANILRDTLAHYLATTHGKGEKDRNKQALSRIVREQAFTVLNRLAALRMAEARGFLLETIAKGYNAKGFQLYKQLAGSALGETGEAYRNYLYSVFDEFSLDLAVLFDRHSAQGRLFPRESALLELLDFINHHEIEPLWAEDETIGWIYQYFNSQEERKQMRAESQVPRNSRELAVRNQFFTPRYVVEFLTDNTLGRIWYEMTQGNTCLDDSCRYLVRRPTEVFLTPGELAPEQNEATGKAEALSQEELLKQPVYIPHRAIKDPRCIRMLDPACGSMHFGLYAFDLYERIYEEAWQLEAELGAKALVREENLKPLHQTYDSFEDYRAEIPQLIIEHNIHGVDIDPRAVQIAGLSLWQRAQRAWQQQGIKPQQRPVVRKSNIVCAEPMPGEKALIQEFSSSLNPPVLGQLLEAVFDKMELAGEAGTLLKIEEEIKSSIHKARDQWQVLSGSNSVGDMFQTELDQATPHKELGFDLSGVDDESFWDGAEQLILAALGDYSDKAELHADQKRLFAEDAAKGFAFIDLCRKRFDVVLMNPPFGEFSEKFRDTAKSLYSSGAHDILTAFVEEGDKLLNKEGILGAITSRTCFFAPTTKAWRERVIQKRLVDAWADLGQGVLDDAMVETAAYTVRKTSQVRHSVFIDCVKSELLPAIYEFRSKNIISNGVYLKYQNAFDAIEGSPFAYWTSNGLLNSLKRMRPLSDHRINVKVGLQTGDDFRFIRCWWEIGDDQGWMPHAKGGENQPYISDIHLVVNWKNDGSEVCAQSSVRLNAYTKINPSDGLAPGLTFPYRTHRFSPAILPKNTITGVAGMGVYSDSRGLYEVLGVLNSSVFNKLIDMRLGLKEINALYQAGTINPIAYPDIDFEQSKFVEEKIIEIVKNNLQLFIDDETSKLFVKKIEVKSENSFSDIARNKNHEWVKSKEKIIQNHSEIDLFVANIYNLTKVESETINTEGGLLLSKCYPQNVTSKENEEHKATSLIIGSLFGRWHNLTSNKSLDVVDLWSDSFLKNKFQYFDRKYPVAYEAEILAKKVFEALVDKGFQANLKHVLNSIVLPSGFFALHLAMYSRSRRQAPIYWPLQSPTGSYTLWIYYHRLNEQTLYACVNDFVQPKLDQVDQDVNALRGKSSRSNQDEKELENLSDLSSELRDFRDELIRIANFWKPSLNDGVQITAAPLWKLFRHKAWQKKLKETWEKLEKGNYDWAHLACSIWPERVLRKCHQDRSLAIAHDVENTFWHEVEVPVKRGKKATGETKPEWQPKELSDAELNALIQAKIREMSA